MLVWAAFGLCCVCLLPMCLKPWLCAVLQVELLSDLDADEEFIDEEDDDDEDFDPDAELEDEDEDDEDW